MALSGFKGQDHITSVLRASIIKESPIRRLAISGDSALAFDIFKAYCKVLNCEHPIKGDSCGTCYFCTHVFPSRVKLYLSDKLSRFGSKVWVPCLVGKDDHAEILKDGYIYCLNGYDAAFSNFSLREEFGAYLNKDFIALVIFGLCGDTAEVVKTSEAIARYCTLKEFISQTLDVFRSIIYLQNNLEIKDAANVDTLLKVASSFPKYVLNSAIAFLLDSSATSYIADELAIQSRSIVLSEILHPTQPPEYTTVLSDGDGKPITVIENSSGQTPLSIEELMRIARE